MPPKPPFIAARPDGWVLADVVDFEHFLAHAPEATAEARATLQERLGPLADAPRRTLLRAWVDLQREGAPQPTPGAALRQGESLLSALAWAAGLLVGVGLAATWLAGAGSEPVNAPLFWAATVGVQLLLLLLALTGWALRRRLVHAGGGLLPVLQGLMGLAGALLRPMPGEGRNAVQAALGRLALRRQAYGPLLAAPAVALAQRFALAFNLGLLGAMLVLHLPLVDLRFGWQSSYPIRPAQMHAAVQALAAPWGWALPQAQPTEAEVATTRYARGQGAAGLPAEAARAWWPFLALSIAFYGLLLRGALLLGARAAQRRALARLRFDHPEANALVRRLVGPLVQAQRGAAQLPAGAPDGPAHAATGSRCALLVAQELALDDPAAQALVQRRFGWAVAGLQRLPLDDRAGAAAPLATLAAAARGVAAWVVLVPAARDPIVAVAQCLREVLQAAPPAAEVMLLLVGPDSGGERLAIWQRFVQIQRLRLGVEAAQ